MSHPETVKEACEQIADLIKEVAQSINQTDLFGEIHIEGEDWPYDSVVNLKMRFPNGGTYETGYSISPMVEEQVDILGRGIPNAIQYYVAHEEVTHGTYRYADGSGEPDTSDLVEDLVTPSLSAAVVKAILLSIELSINQFLESKYEDEMMKEEADLEEVY